MFLISFEFLGISRRIKAMENLDKTMFTNNEEDLQKIYEEEAKKLHDNEFKLNILKRLMIDDFPRDLAEDSRKNIEKALLAVKIKEHITLENGQKVLGKLKHLWWNDFLLISINILGLENFEVNKIPLNYHEKKLIRERFEHLMNLERKKNLSARQNTDELKKAQEKFIQLQKENIAQTEALADLKQQELQLMKQVADVLVSPTQKLLVEKILQEAKIAQLQVCFTNQVIKESEMGKTSHVKKAVTEVSGYIDELLQKKELSGKWSFRFNSVIK